MIKNGTIFYNLPYQGSINQTMKNHIENEACTMFLRFVSYDIGPSFICIHGYLMQCMHLKFLLKLSNTPRNWQRIVFTHYKEFIETAKVCTQL